MTTAQTSTASFNDLLAQLVRSEVDRRERENAKKAALAKTNDQKLWESTKDLANFLWQLLKAFIARCAQLLGLRATLPDKLPEENATNGQAQTSDTPHASEAGIPYASLGNELSAAEKHGNAPVKTPGDTLPDIIDVAFRDITPTASGAKTDSADRAATPLISVDVAKHYLLAEADRFIRYIGELESISVDSVEDAHLQIERVGQLAAYYKQCADVMKSGLAQHLEEKAKQLGTTTQALQQQLNSPSGQLLYGQQLSELRAQQESIDKLCLGVKRCENVAMSWVDALRSKLGANETDALFKACLKHFPTASEQPANASDNVVHDHTQSLASDTLAQSTKARNPFSALKRTNSNKMDHLDEAAANASAMLDHDISASPWLQPPQKDGSSDTSRETNRTERPTT